MSGDYTAAQLTSRRTSHERLFSLVRRDLEGRFNEVDVLRREWPRIRALNENITIPPFEVLIHPSSACNLQCVWCIGDHIPIEKRGRIMEASKQSPLRIPDLLRSPSNMKRLVEGIIGYKKRVELDCETFDFRIEAVQFSGLIGEPLASKTAVLAAIPLLVDASIRVGLFTNGVLVDQYCAEQLQQLNYVNVSLDAGTSETYSLLKSQRRDIDTFGLVLANLERLTEVAERRQSNLVVNSSFVMFPENHDEVYLAASLLKERGVRTLKIKQDISGKRLLSHRQAQKAKDLLDRIDAELVDANFKLIRIHSVLDANAGARHFARCRVTDLMAAVGSDGNLYPCNYHPRPGGAVYGNAVAQPFQEVWESSQRARQKNQLPNICPDVCDPFKNRANHLLEALDNLRAHATVAELDQAVGHVIELAGLDPL